MLVLTLHVTAGAWTRAYRNRPNRFFLFYFNCPRPSAIDSSFVIFVHCRCTTRSREFVPRRHSETQKIVWRRRICEPSPSTDHRSSKPPRLVLFLMFYTNCGSEDGYSKRGKTPRLIREHDKTWKCMLFACPSVPLRLGCCVARVEFGEHF